MEPDDVEKAISCHVVAIPYPGRGHVNPMINLCNLIASRRADFLITVVVTEEWLSFLGSDSKPANFRFCTVPNVIPSELVRAVDFPGFYEAVMTKLEAPVELLLERLETPPSAIVYDTRLTWVVGLANRRNIPVASLWTVSATVFSLFNHYDVIVLNGHHPVNLPEQGEEQINYIPGVPSMRVADLPTPFTDRRRDILDRVLEAISLVPKAHYLLFTSIYELEAQIIDALKAKFLIPIYCIGPAIPYFKIGHNIPPTNYVMWLDSQPKDSVLYISQGSFLSVSSAQLDEIVAGVRDSGVRYLWIAREETSRLNGGSGGKGLVVPWCDQLKVLCHPSVGGFWSHCGWNSTKEGVFAGVPMLTFPIMLDQVTNSKRIVQDWKVGWRVKSGGGAETLVTREEIAGLLKRFMDLESDEGKEMRRRSEELKEICRRATAEGGSSEIDIDAFIEDISQCHSH